jgi:single-strand DNA-binding protein
MAIHTQQSLSGFIVGDPELSVTRTGESRLYARIGQEHFQRNNDGTFTQLEPTFHNLVQYRRAAERTAEKFAKGDHFVAEGYVHEYDHEVDGQMQHGEEFVAKKIGHDAARQNYTVNRKLAVSETLDQDRALQFDGAAESASPTISNSLGNAPVGPFSTPAGRTNHLADLSSAGFTANPVSHSRGLAL